MCPWTRCRDTKITPDLCPQRTWGLADRHVHNSSHFFEHVKLDTVLHASHYTCNLGYLISSTPSFHYIKILLFQLNRFKNWLYKCELSNFSKGTKLTDVTYSNVRSQILKPCVFLSYQASLQGPYTAHWRHKGKRSQSYLVKIMGHETCLEQLQKLNHWLGSWRRSKHFPGQTQEKGSHSR